MIKRSYLLTRVMGIPVRVHITLIALLIFAAFQSGFWGVLYTVGLFSSVALHELGHSWIAIRKGCRVHEIMLLPIGGVAKMTGIPSRPTDEFLIAVAGPLTSLALAGIFWQFCKTGFPAILFANLTGINLMLGLFNLLPSFPMDGGRIFRAFMTPRLGRLKATALAARIGRIMAVVFAITGLMSGLPTFNKLLMIAIAIFIYQAAGAEYRAVYLQQMSQDWFTVGQPADIEVSPPPYGRTTPPFWAGWKNRTNSFFADLFKNWG
ncbi:MAG: site-2 protease family protein [Kiritimatiellales bacterium]|jgi:Zn-dependent protease